ncbi:aldehyde dehydrogenase [Streptococcus sp. HMSC062B01]|uniref:aldehyde dehydrogenase family protein n=1 Tax=Streptococcus sp. HMSC062B01 TaxID=1739284 RepID=UPI0008C479E3|nr:aldehyde dehydrogenase family protein [Streptococcus sp. HMSC062B01]OFL22487.1 aldehyde dehydrogenase [Streptococcus sp. HMSC062B01]
MRYIDKDLDSIQEMRNLLLNAQMSFLQLQYLEQNELNVYGEKFIEKIEQEADKLISEYIARNDYGLEADEVFLFHHFLNRFKEKIQKENYIGILEGDVAKQTIEIGVPLGVVAVLLPPNPTFTLLVNIILLTIKSGNSLVVVANKRNKPAVIDIFKQLLLLAEQAGYPQGGIGIIEATSDSSILELYDSDKASLIINIGCPEYINKNFKTTIPTIYGGEGSGPVFIERSADINKAVKDIIHSRSFDNGILPGSEQFLVTENIIEQEIREALVQEGAYILNETECTQLIGFLEKSKNNTLCHFAGQSAKWLASMSGFEVPDTTRVLVSLQDYINHEDFFNQKLLCPIMIVYLEPDWKMACHKCMSLLSELKMGHTLTIHSKDWEVIREFALVKEVGRMVVNSPTACVATGVMSHLPTSLILGGITTGRGYTSENITPKHWTYRRQVGFKVDQ